MNFELVAVTIALLFGSNYVVAQGWALCPFIGVSRKLDSAIGIGMAAIFVSTVSTTLIWLIFNFVVAPLGFEFLDLLVFIIIIASFVGITEIFIRKFVPTLYSSLGVYLPLLATNCMIFQVAIYTTTGSVVEFMFLDAVLYGLFAGIGFLLVIVLLAGIREKLARVKIARPFQGFPISLLAASIIGMAFYGLMGIFM